jgi:hypothetical protein
MDHQTAQRVKWQPTKEQYRIWKSIFLFGWTFILKPRQIGATTAFIFELCVWCAAMDAAGERVNVGTFIDTESKADAMRDRAIDMFEQLGIEVTSKQGKLTLPGGTCWFFATAGSKRAAASLSLHRVHLTELPFWKNPTAAYNSIMPALSPGGWPVIDTTMGLDDPIGKFLWYESERYAKVFFSVEDHDEYRKAVDPRILTDEKWEWLQGEGFTIPEAAMWWLVTLSDVCAGDIARCFREYPQLPEHAFRYAEGTWIAGETKAIEPLETYRVPGTLALLEVFVDPEDCVAPMAIGVDTSFGMGRDACTVSCVDSIGRLCASWSDVGALIDTTVGVLAEAQRLFSRNGQVPVGVIEINGVGMGTLQNAQQRGLIVIGENMDASKKQLGMLGVKRGIEGGTIRGGESLAAECRELRVKGSKWVGPKDLMMATGFAYRYLGLCDGIWAGEDEVIEDDPPEVFSPNVFNLKKRMELTDGE